MDNLRRLIRKILAESLQTPVIDGMVDEERLTNPEGQVKVKNKENFVGSHCFGEWIGPEGSGIYAVFSYGEQFPIYIFEKDTWYENSDQYVYDGQAQSSTEEHRQDLKPTTQTHTKTTEEMKDMVDRYKSKFGVSELSHSSVVPGIKN